jgi:hypothetical protein
MDFEKRLSGLFEEDGEINSGAFESISEEKANEVLSSDCSEFEKQQQIFNLIPRNELESEGDFFIYDPLQANRPYNKLYNVMFMDKSEPWTDFPKRKNAIVAYANKDKITEDGVTYIAVPFNSTKLGVAPKETLEDSFNNVSINLGMKFEYFNRSFNILLNIFNNPEGTYEADTKKLHLEGEKFYDHSYAELQQAIAKADEQLQSSEGKQTVEGVLGNPFNKETEANVISIIEYLEAKKISVQEMVDTLFNPSDNNFKFIGFNEFVVGESKENEVWFNNKCLLVKESVFESLSFPSHGHDEGEGVEDEPTDEEPVEDEPMDDEGGEEEAPIEDEPMDDEGGEEEAPVEDEPEEEEEEEDGQMESYLATMERYKTVVIPNEPKQD